MPAVASEQIGNYVLDSELGRGAFGVVYRAHHVEEPDSPVALKLVEPNGPIDRMMLEPALLSQLNHSCIVGIEDYFQHKGKLALVLEYVEGEDLKAMLDRGETFSPEQIRMLLTQIGGALATAHARQIVHRDIKPGNILVVRDGPNLRFVLTDFGIGQRVEGIQDRKHTGGTYLFMAPEQLRGRPGPQSDLWALGVVAYRLLTGKMPFPGPSLPELANQILYVNPEPPSQAGAGSDSELEAIILRLLEKSLQERTPTAEALLRQLGHEGLPSDVLTRSSIQAKKRVASDETLERKLERSLFWRRFWLIVIMLLYLVPSGPISTATLLIGCLLFYRYNLSEAPAKKKWHLLALASVLFLTHTVLRQIISEQSLMLIGGQMLRDSSLLRDSEVVRMFVPVLGVLAVAVMVTGAVFAFFAPAIMAAIFVRIRRLKREQILRQAALQGGANSDRFLEILREGLLYRSADVGFHLKYAEGLVARGKLVEACVEAQLIVEQDPYNFAGNLLLANCYYNLGLFDDCLAACDRYLEVSGYCFEFEELSQQCLRKGARP